MADIICHNNETHATEAFYTLLDTCWVECSQNKRSRVSSTYSIVKVKSNVDLCSTPSLTLTANVLGGRSSVNTACSQCPVEAKLLQIW